MDDEYKRANRLNWDDRAGLHASDATGSYRIAKVLAGGSSLHRLETDEIGDMSGKAVAHLQCHIGLDTISLKHRGAAEVVGLDFSPKAITAARGFAAQAGAEARFVEGDVMEAPALLGTNRFDLVFVTWGAINWIADIVAWAQVVAALLKPGGSLYLLEGHPQMNQLEARNGRLELAFDWRTPQEKPLVWDDAQTYTGDARLIARTRNYEWIHPISDVVNATIAAGLRLDFLREHEIVVWKAFPFVEEAGEDQFALPAGQVKVPMSFSLGATKPDR